MERLLFFRLTSVAVAAKTAYNKALYDQAVAFYQQAFAEKIRYDQWMLQQRMLQEMQFKMLMDRSPQKRYPDLHKQYYVRSPHMMPHPGFKR